MCFVCFACFAFVERRVWSGGVGDWREVWFASASSRWVVQSHWYTFEVARITLTVDRKSGTECTKSKEACLLRIHISWVCLLDPAWVCIRTNVAASPRLPPGELLWMRILDSELAVAVSFA